MEKNELNYLLEENYKKIFILAIKMLKNYEDAEDVTQDIFMKAYQNIDKFRGESKFSTWLYRIALNHIYNFHKSKKTQAKINPNNQVLSDKNTPETILYEKELYVKLDEIIDKLPKMQKKVFLLRYYNQFKFKKIAKILKRNLETVKSNYFFAMQKIKTSLEKNNLLEFKDN
ncbi:MAG: RNA polymerase sigma factor [Candidatus Cloacimonetes bacterium]|nr:RNA polymerase sigma factor [Candidatus Cloacimonadota bacterium]MBL7086438.1 RNA polymerase sigma factor [Candidatus Cloacimonadota bacterium]